MLAKVKEFWWPQIYADICAVTELRAECINEAEDRADEPLVVDSEELSAAKLNTCSMGETWLVKQAVLDTELAPFYKFATLTEESVSEEKPITPKQKATRKVGRAKQKSKRL